LPLKVFFLQPGSASIAADATSGLSLMETAVNHGVVGIDALCGGACACATCHVYVEPAWMALVGTAGADEAALLECTDFPRENSRLACQIRLSDDLAGLAVSVAPRLNH
jgi:2Fe-2S ferredoxin